jgi:hypothetical protein
MLDAHNNLIPQNNNENLTIIKNKSYKSVDVLIKHSYEINLENLYLVFKSYLQTETALLKYILIIGYNNEYESIPIFHHVNIRKQKKMKYIDFCL